MGQQADKCPKESHETFPEQKDPFENNSKSDSKTNPLEPHTHTRFFTNRTLIVVEMCPTTDRRMFTTSQREQHTRHAVSLVLAKTCWCLSQHLPSRRVLPVTVVTNGVWFWEPNVSQCEKRIVGAKRTKDGVHSVLSRHT